MINYEDMRARNFLAFEPDEVYLDWTGTAQAPDYLAEDFVHGMKRRKSGNPHSHHQPSQEAMERINRTRRDILRYFNAPEGEYEVVFTANATGAILLLQHYVFEGGELLLTADNHNSMNGLREVARRNGAVTRYAPIGDDLQFDEDALERMLRYPRSNGNRLFGFPAKSNYSGITHPLKWVRFAQENGWDVVLDAAAFVSNDRLDLSQVQPDFVPVSFYKMFGFPTGIGCLLIRRRVYRKLSKRWFSGGSILLVSVMKDFYAPEPTGYARFEDGTVNFNFIPAVSEGLAFLGELPNLKAHTVGLAEQLYDGLRDLEIGGNRVQIHSPRGTDIVTFSVLRANEVVNAWEVEQAASESKIYMRTGCFCNPGVNEKVFGYTVDAFERMYNDAIQLDQVSLEMLRAHSGGKPIGAVRASFGYMNVPADVKRTTRFMEAYLARL